MLIPLLVIIALSMMAARVLPYVYEQAKSAVINDSKHLENENRRIATRYLWAMICVMPSLLIFYLSEDIWMSGIILLLGGVAYTDLMARWVPDLFIYACLCISLLARPINNGVEMLLSVILFILPAAILQLITCIRNGKAGIAIASGDVYLFPAVAVWIDPEYAASVMLVSLGMALLLSVRIKEVPFMTCLFSVFVGYQVCALLFLF